MDLFQIAGGSAMPAITSSLSTGANYKGPSQNSSLYVGRFWGHRALLQHMRCIAQNSPRGEGGERAPSVVVRRASNITTALRVPAGKWP